MEDTFQSFHKSNFRTFMPKPASLLGWLELSLTFFGASAKFRSITGENKMTEKNKPKRCNEGLKQNAKKNK